MIKISNLKRLSIVEISRKKKEEQIERTNELTTNYVIDTASVGFHFVVRVTCSHTFQIKRNYNALFFEKKTLNAS